MTTKDSTIPIAFLAGAVAASIATLLAYRRFLDKSDRELAVHLPKWLLDDYNSGKDKEYTSDEDMIKMAVKISKDNVAAGTGGPFGCAIFERDTATGIAKLFSVGCNLVVPNNNSTLHAEMVAIQFAQKKRKHFSLSTKEGDGREYVLCTSCEPCAMCLGGTMWSGVAELQCSAAKDDAEAIGFNEGPVFPESYKMLEEMGMRVKRGICRAEGAAVLKHYGETGVIYNG